MEFSRSKYEGEMNADLKFEDDNGVYNYPDGSRFEGKLKVRRAKRVMLGSVISQCTHNSRVERRFPWRWQTFL